MRSIAARFRCAVAIIVLFIAAAGSYGGQAERLLEDAGVKAGFIVHVGCGDGRLTAGLGADSRYIVQGLDADAGNVEKAREYIGSQGLYGRVSVDRLSGGQLPFIENLVNLVISEDLGEVSMDEVMRVLAPNGVAYIRKGGEWSRSVKARPEAMDEWTHYLHDPQGTLVGKDTIVGPPRRMQWRGGPKWLRNHDFMTSLSGMVSASGRIFYIIDEGLPNHIYLPVRWNVVARDAFNGTILWKRKIDRWWPHTVPFKTGPGVLPRRIVAVGDRVYVTLGIDAPLTALDAATGETIRTYEQTKGTGEIVLDGGVLYLVADPDKGPFPYKHASPNRGAERNRVNEEFGWSKDSAASVVMAVAADSGKVLWRHKDRVAPTTLAVAGEKIVYFDGERVIALDRGDGEKKWTSENVGNWAVPATGYTARLMVGDGVIIISTRRGIGGGRLVGLSAADGKILWRSSQLKSGHFSPEDLFLINGVVWTAQTGKSQVKGTKFQGVDAKTGETKFDFVAEQIEAFFMHQRCYPGRATERYIMASGTGTEFLELGTEECEIHHWLRGNCIYGIMPCNGLIYKSPDRCACYYQSKLHHLCAIAPAGERLAKGPKDSRLEKGSAYGAIRRPGRSRADSWPAYRHDNARSGTTRTNVTAKPVEVWKTDIGGKLSTMTAAGGKLFVAAIDRHTVYALAADTGKKAWSYTAGGRVDSPPTIYEGMAVFGCGDGWVYCLRASDGELAWRFRAAPGPDKLVSYEQPESVWPVHGSVLIREGVVYALAGHNIFLDGGMHLVRLDCATGKLLSETVMDDKDPATGKNIQTLIAGKAMPVANGDLFSCDEDNIYMGPQKIDFAGKRVDIAIAVGKERVQTGPGRHLFCPTGFLDDYWFHRSYFMYGINAGEGHGEYATARGFAPVGRIMVFDDSKIYSFFAHNVGNNINPRTHYSLFAVAKNPPAAGPVPQPAPAKRQARNPKRKQPKVPVAVPKNKQRKLWEIEDAGILANAMVLAGDKLFLAGVPDVADEKKTFDYVYGADDELHRELREQEKAWLGEKGALLWAVSAETGEKLGEYKIPAVPVWDGMIAAAGRLYLATKDGYVRCLGEK